ncbi:MAG: hypothetical protein IKP09_01935 [Lentisphaeria bacterium]|nr:hypothetical protein [Lentisphaeria bacterium]
MPEHILVAQIRAADVSASDQSRFQHVPFSFRLRRGSVQKNGSEISAAASVQEKAQNKQGYDEEKNVPVQVSRLPEPQLELRPSDPEKTQRRPGDDEKNGDIRRPGGDFVPAERRIGLLRRGGPGFCLLFRRGFLFGLNPFRRTGPDRTDRSCFPGKQSLILIHSFFSDSCIETAAVKSSVIYPSFRQFLDLK